MTKDDLKNLVRLWYRQGLFTGDLDRVGQLCLAWAVSDERGEQAKFQIDLNEMLVASTNPELYRRLKQPEPENPWLPADEFEQMLAEAQALRVGSEESES